MALFMGLMSGTSLDGVDGVLAEFQAGAGQAMRVLAHGHAPFPDDLRAELLSLNQPGDNELHRAALAANQLADVYAKVVAHLLSASGVQKAAVAAIGAHGQTVRHHPGQLGGDGGDGYTLQLFNGARLAEKTGIDVVCDFRSRDVAAGGQGAPLVPAFHAAWLGQPNADTALLNLGGIGNLTLLHADGQVGGFDCGPGNALLDMWCQRHLGVEFDDRGAWAASGHLCELLLAKLAGEAFFQQPPPKSTGRDLFHEQWLSGHLHPEFDHLSEADVQNTLAELTVRAAADAVTSHLPNCKTLWVCGGGALNLHLLDRLRKHLPHVRVQSTASLGVPPGQVEALAFAWLAQAHLNHRPGNVPQVTGAKGPRLLGARYPA